MLAEIVFSMSNSWRSHEPWRRQCDFRLKGDKSLMLHRMLPEAESLRASRMPLRLWGNCAGGRPNPCNHGMAFAASRNGVRAASRATDLAILIRLTSEW